MAKFDYKMPDSFINQISNLKEHTDETIGKALTAGGKVLAKEMKKQLKTSVGKGTKYPSKSTGELVNSVGVTPAAVDKQGNYNVKIGFNEPRRKQYKAKGKRSYNVITNAMIANTIEYGKSGQPPKPFISPAKNAGKKECIAAMQEVLESELNKK